MDKQKEFLDKVIDHILKKTDIDYDIKQITNWPFYRHGMGFNIFMSAPHSAFGILERHFYFYCKEVYGLTKEESKYVWEGYINMLGETIKLIGENINESGDKQKEFLDKVLEMLKSETEFKVVKNDVTVGHKYDYYWKYPFSDFTTLSPYYPRSGNSHFHKHCRNIYGLTNEEIEQAFAQSQ